MPEQTLPTQDQFALYAFTDSYWSSNKEESISFHNNWLVGLHSTAHSVDIFQNSDNKANMFIYHPSEETLKLWK